VKPQGDPVAAGPSPSPQVWFTTQGPLGKHERKIHDSHKDGEEANGCLGPSSLQLSQGDEGGRGPELSQGMAIACINCKAQVSPLHKAQLSEAPSKFPAAGSLVGWVPGHTSVLGWEVTARPLLRHHRPLRGSWHCCVPPVPQDWEAAPHSVPPHSVTHPLFQVSILQSTAHQTQPSPWVRVGTSSQDP
jgi:hypothetical protein